MKINGKFDVEFLNDKGEVVRSIIQPNNITIDGIKQIKKWLDRKEYIANRVNRHDWKNPYCYAMEQRKVAVLSGITSPYNTWVDSATANYDLMFDLGYNSCMAFWNDRDTWQYLDIKFKEPI